jgi:hypothetical protein
MQKSPQDHETPAKLRTIGDVLNAMINDGRLKPVDHNVTSRGLTLCVGGFQIAIEFRPVDPNVSILEDGTIVNTTIDNGKVAQHSRKP